ncbi:MAG: hypothetical protein QXG46_01325 [Ignisphaera sp.]
MSINEHDKVMYSIINYMKMYLVAVALFATTMGLLVRSYVAIEAGFKISIVVLFTIAVERMIYTHRVEIVSTVSIVSIAITAFYFIQHAKDFIGLVAYVMLSIVFLIMNEKNGRKINTLLDIVSLNIMLYYIATSLFLVTRDSLTVLETLTIIAITTLFVVKTYCIKSKAFYKVHELSRYLIHTLGTNIDKIFNTLSEKLLKNKQKTEAISRRLSNSVTKVLQNLAHIDIPFIIIELKTIEYMMTISKKFLEFEKYIENLLIKIFSALERIQHSMEHSFLFFVFLMSILILISMMFYILLHI